jgi:HlyD family secretion protein
VEPGDVVQPGKTLVVLALASEALLLAQPDEKNLSSLRIGQKARASADAYPGKSFAAEVSWIAPGIDVTRGTVDVKLRVPDPPETLRTDMTLSIEIEVGRKKGALVVPAESVHDTGRRPWLLVDAGGRAERRDVALGLVGDGGAEVLSGVAEGEAVLRPAPGVAEGSRVRAAFPPARPR